MSNPSTHLSSETQRWRETVLAEFVNPNAAVRELVELACGSRETVREAETLVARDGMTLTDKKGVLKQNPACAVLNNARNALGKALAFLAKVPRKPLAGAEATPFSAFRNSALPPIERAAATSKQLVKARKSGRSF